MSRSFPQRWLCAIWTLVVLVAASPAIVAAEPQARVTIVVAADAEQHASVLEVLSERLEPLGVALASTRAETIDVDRALRPDPTIEVAVARVWIDLVDVEQARLYITDAARERVLVRAFERASRSDEVLREELGLIVLAAVETLLAGATIGAPRDEVRADLGLAVVQPPPPKPPPPKPAPPPPKPPPPPPKPPPPPPELPPDQGPGWRFGGAVVYEAQGYAEEQVLVHGPGLSMTFDAPSVDLAPGVMFDVQYRIPYEQEGEEAGFRLQSLALRLQAHLHVLRHSAVALRFHGGFAAETLFLEPFLIQEGEAVLAPSRTRVAPIARLGLIAQLHLFGDTSLRLGFSGDIDIIGTRYVIQRGEELVPLVEPLRIRPSLTVGIATTFAGAHLFPVADDPFGP